MFRRSGWGAGAVMIVLTTWAGIAALGADDTPAKTLRSPEDVLSARGLARSGARFVLEKQEKECFDKFDEIRPDYEKLETDSNKLAAITMSEAQVAQLETQQAVVRQQIQSLSASGNSMGRFGGRYARYARNPNTQLQQQLRAQQSVLSQQLALAKQAVPAKEKQGATASYEKHRDELLKSSAKVRELFERVQKEYTDIEAEPPVRNALAALRKSAKAQLKIAPSTEFDKKLAMLKKLERMLRPDSPAQAPLAKRKGKTQAKSKR